MKNYKLAVVGATGLVGRTALTVLQEKNLPISEYVFFASQRSAGSKIDFLGKEYIIQELTENSFDEGFDFAIFCAGGDTSKQYAYIATRNTTENKKLIMPRQRARKRPLPCISIIIAVNERKAADEDVSMAASPTTNSSSELLLPT